MIRLLVGLGNPGSEYEATRHNAGFWFIDEVARALKVSLVPERSYFGLAARANTANGPVWLLEPMTFMNLFIPHERTEEEKQWLAEELADQEKRYAGIVKATRQPPASLCCVTGAVMAIVSRGACVTGAVIAISAPPRSFAKI